MKAPEAEEAYRSMLSDDAKFCAACRGVIKDWHYSCEHYLTNEKMNRIAWMGQAALAYAHGIPAHYRGGYNALTEDQQSRADDIALCYINIWMERNKYSALTKETIKNKTQANIY